MAKKAKPSKRKHDQTLPTWPNEDRELMEMLKSEHPNHTAKDWVEEALHYLGYSCSDVVIRASNMLGLAWEEMERVSSTSK